MAFKLVISDPKSGKSYQKDFDQTGLLVGKKLGETLPGDAFGLSGYELQIMGGSDKIGVPMRKDVEGTTSRRLLLTKGVGYRAKFKIKKDGKVWYDSEPKGARMKKRVRGNTIGPEMIQVNLKVVKAGAQALEQIFPKKEAAEKKEAPKPA